jgi:hypothetical protein
LVRLVAPSFFAACLLASLAVTLHPARGDTVSVLAPGWTVGGSALLLVIKAGGRLIAVHAGGAIVQARSDEPDFVARLYRAGALLVLRTGSRPCQPPTSPA